MYISWRFWSIFCFILLYHPVQAVSQEVEIGQKSLNPSQEILLDVSKLALGEGVNARMFSPSQMISFELSKKELKKIYWEEGQNRTLHCGCFFDKIQQLAPQTCAHGRKDGNRLRERKFLGWVHAVPVATFAKLLKCWDEALCKGGRQSGDSGARCCKVLSQKFKRREADMHNIFPAILLSDPEKMESSPVFGGMTEYRYCSEHGKPGLTPRPGARGDIARAYFYMSRQYKFAIPQVMEDRLRQWHLKDPPDTWEEERNSLIELVQGNRNPFIDHPEQVERVGDF